MALISEDKLDEIRTRADIVEVIGAHVRLKRAGRNFVGLCPFHNEKTPSFSVNSERGFFHCFGCGAGGTVFNFVMRTEGLSFPEAIESLARRYGVTLPERGGEAGPGARRARRRVAGQSGRGGFFRPCVVEDARRRGGARLPGRARCGYRDRAHVRSWICARPAGQPGARAGAARLVGGGGARGPGQAGRRGHARHVSRTADVPDSRRPGAGARLWRPRARSASAEISSIRPNHRSTPSRAMSTDCMKRARRSRAPTARSWSRATSTRSRCGRRVSRRR